MLTDGVIVSFGDPVFSKMVFFFFVAQLALNTGAIPINFRRRMDCDINLLKPAGYVMHQQFNIQQL
jgi:hypothetical protein